MDLPIAHAGHWTDWRLYGVPVAIVFTSIAASRRRQRREHAERAQRPQA